MQTESTIKPDDFAIEETKNGRCTVYFFTNIEEIEKETEDGATEILYTYDEYKLDLLCRDNLQSDIENDLETWLNFAKDKEESELAAKIRTKRNELLADTDWTQCADTALSDEEVEEYKVYRQALRDITAQEKFPYSVTFPDMP